jgi:peptide/nickel transport system permease protein
VSLRQGRKVSALIAERLPATLELSIVAGVIACWWAFRWACMRRCKRGSFGSQWR